MKYDKVLPFMAEGMCQGDGSNGINIRKDKQAEDGTETEPGQ